MRSGSSCRLRHGWILLPQTGSTDPHSNGRNRFTARFASRTGDGLMKVSSLPTLEERTYRILGAGDRPQASRRQGSGHETVSASMSSSHRVHPYSPSSPPSKSELPLSSTKFTSPLRTLWQEIMRFYDSTILSLFPWPKSRPWARLPEVGPCSGSSQQ